MALLTMQSLLDAREIGISGEDNAGIAEVTLTLTLTLTRASRRSARTLGLGSRV